MLRNYLAAALRNLVRNPLYTSINVIGLSIGLAAALLIAVYVRDEFAYDRWIPGHEDVYMVTMTRILSGRAPVVLNMTPPDVAGRAKLEIPSVETVARLGVDLRATVFRVGEVESSEPFLWADP